MKRLVELAAFSALSILIHVVLFARPSDEGMDAGGTGGATMLTLEAADATVADMVEAWERPPTEVQISVQELSARAEQMAPAPNLPNIDLVEPSQATMRLTLSPPETQPLVQKTTIPRPDTRLPDIQLRDVPARPDSAPGPLRADTSRPELSQPAAIARLQDLTKAPTIDTKTAPSPPSDTAPKASLRPPVRPKTDVPETARKAEKTSLGRAAQRAAGAGGSSEAGRSKATQKATASTGQQARAQQVWGAKIRSRIERAKRYPRGTDASGQVSLVLSVARGGELLGVRIRQSSGNSRLDEAALNAVRRAGRFPAAPEELPSASYSFAIAVLLKR